MVRILFRGGAFMKPFAAEDWPSYHQSTEDAESKRVLLHLDMFSLYCTLLPFGLPLDAGVFIPTTQQCP